MRKVKFHCRSQIDDHIGEKNSEKNAEENLSESKNISEEAEANEEKSSKDLVSSSIENWEGEFEDLLDIFSRGFPIEKKG